MKPPKHLTFLYVLFFCGATATAQEMASSTLLQQPGKLYSSIADKASAFDGQLEKATDKYLSKLQKQEAKLKAKLFKKDSTLAHQLFDGIDQKYTSLKTLTQKLSASASVYSGHLDSLTTSLKFLQNNPLTNKVEIGKSLGQLSNLQNQLNQTEIVKKFIQERKEILKSSMEKLNMLKYLKGFQKQAYYYGAKINEIKTLWQDPTALEKRILEEVIKLPAFKEFFSNNSMLGSLFALPGGSNSNATASVAGLQTRASVMAGITQRFGAGATTMIQQNVQQAQGQLNELKNKLASLNTGSYGNSSGDIDMPEGFKPNNEKTRSFFKRLEFGANIQSQKARNYFPQTNDLGLSVGFRVSDRFITGIGTSMKIGLGRDWSHLALSYEGASFRSYIDWKLKGSLYLSGGYEQNYRTAFRNVQQLRNNSLWQNSALIGVAKRYSVGGKKLKGEMKLLLDCMSFSQIPRGQPVIFRIGYSLK